MKTDYVEPCNEGEGLCLLPKHDGDCITAADIAAKPALAHAEKCPDCGRWGRHALRCSESEAVRLERAETVCIAGARRAP